MIFWMCWNWPSCSRECLLYWLRWHQVIEMSSLSVKKPKSAFQYFRLWKWGHVGTPDCGLLSGPTDYGNSHMSGFKIQNTLNTGHCSPHIMTGRLWSMSWKYCSYSSIGRCACRRGIQSYCITLSQCTMTCSITWMAWCGLWLRTKHIGKKPCSLLSSYLDSSCPNTMLKGLQQRACFSFLHISSIPSEVAILYLVGQGDQY